MLARHDIVLYAMCLCYQKCMHSTEYHLVTNSSLLLTHSYLIR